MERLQRLLRERWRRLGAGIGLVAGGTGAALALPRALGAAVEAAVGRAGPAVVGRALAAACGLIALRAALRLASRGLLLALAADVERALRDAAFAHAVRLGPASHRRTAPGALQSQLLHDLTSVRVLLGPGLVNLVTIPLLWLVGLVAMLHLSAPLTLVALLAYAAALAVTVRRSRRLLAHAGAVQAALARLATRVHETVVGIRAVKGHAAEGAAVAACAAAATAVRDQALALARLRAPLDPVVSLAGGAALLAVVWLGGRAAASGSLGVGGLVAFTGYLGLVAAPTTALGWLADVVSRARAALVRLDALLAEPLPDAALGSVPKPPPRAEGALVLHDVTVRRPGRPGGPPLLDGIRLAIPAGTRMAIVGPSGAGKTTLVRLLARLGDPDAGRVTLDGRDLRTLPAAWIRARVALVADDAAVFARSIRDNVALAAGPDADPATLAAALDAAGLAGTVAALPQGWDTVVGERGATLSGGQRQRLALARALATGAPVLVLDDALAGLDAATEAAVLDALDTATRGRTLVFVTHRASQLRLADVVAVLDAGRVVETGPPSALAAAGGTFAALFGAPPPPAAREVG